MKNNLVRDIRWQTKAGSFYQYKKTKKGAWAAHRALAHKLCRAGYFMLRDREEYSSARLFGSGKRGR